MKKNNRFQKRLTESWPWLIMLLPALIYVAIFSYGPMAGLQIAFKNYRASKGMWGSPWVGFDHFIKFFKYPNFWKMIKNTLSITLYHLATFPIPVIFALLINEVRHPKTKKTIQMVTYMPHFLSGVVVCSLVILFLDRNGPINSFLQLFGVAPKNYMADPEVFSSIYVWSGVWQNLGWQSILYISALSAVPSEETEAALIDGANRFQTMMNVNLPHILPTVAITLILAAGGVLSVGFSKIYLLQNSLNLENSTVLSTYTYEMGILGGQYSYSTAVGLFSNLISVIVLVLVNQVVKKLSGTGLL